MSTNVNPTGSQSNSTNGTSGSKSSTQSSGTAGYDSLNTDAFMKMLIAELSNQDPTQPMDSAQIVQQVSQIRSIQASDQLSTTLQSVLLGQNVATASGLLGKAIAGLSDDSKQVSGVVSGVTVTNGDVKLYVGDSTVSLKNITAIAADSVAQQ
jgi:flagellar hook assembly protein FlgD